MAMRAADGFSVHLQDKLEEQLAQLVKKHGLHRIGIETSYLTVASLMNFRKSCPMWNSRRRMRSTT
jgi:hypothetical protein